MSAPLADSLLSFACQILELDQHHCPLNLLEREGWGAPKHQISIFSVLLTISAKLTHYGETNLFESCLNLMCLIHVNEPGPGTRKLGFPSAFGPSSLVFKERQKQNKVFPCWE